MLKKTEVRQGVFACHCRAQFPRILYVPAIAVAVGCLTSPSDVWAQDDLNDAEIDAQAIEEILVTGSRIKRRDFNTPSPLVTISNDDIAFSGQATIEETLNQMPQVLPEFGRTSNNPLLATILALAAPEWICVVLAQTVRWYCSTVGA